MFNSNKPTNNKAFTLVELIVVIVILAILATIAFLSFSSQSWSARDSTRLADISSIKKWLEMYNVWSWLYPNPDNPSSFTYSGWTIWNQWILWDSAYKLIQKTLSKKVKDPLKNGEYDYSLASNKREYQVAWNFENPTSFERNYNPFDSSSLSPKLSALGWTGANVYISWNYNWVMLKVFTWSTYYFVPTPTLFWINASAQPTIAFDSSFSSWKIMLPWVNNFASYKADQIYSTWWNNLSSIDISALMTKIQTAYSGSNITSPGVLRIAMADPTTLESIGTAMVKNVLGGWVTTLAWWSGWVARPDANTLLLLHFDDDTTNQWYSTWTVTNNGVTFTANWKFWKAWYFDWVNKYLSVSKNNDWNFWTNDFTVDAWVNYSSITGYAHDYIFDISNSDLSKRIYIVTSNELANYNYFWYLWNSVWFNSSKLSVWNWQHFAMTRKWWTMYCFIDWYLIGSYTAWSLDNVEHFKIWTRSVYNYAESYLNWYIDEFRVSNISRWDWNGFTAWQKVFTPPSSPY
ncbi:MAG: hypothetical protein ACD_3C00044G0003 [uncultured bacterium (gcode 4)]|uniref:Uncharacterized protein n=1 Tax=uncultured bacterium (gcode 4) TaxID=1234023 RepID=K2FBQ1_9BACT|nr:MAG: hypothetical protein ACD_3C00044G0003 [uncultured bacterium (gcode 4)]